MANERKEPTLSSASLESSRKTQTQAPTSNDTEARSRPASTAPNTRARQPSRTAAPRQQVVVKSNKTLLFFVFLLSLLAVIGVAYSIWQLQQANDTITDQQQRIVELEKKLTVAGDTSSQSITSLAANLSALNDDVKLSLTEIDKLWATRNVNRDAISDNAEKINALEALSQQVKTVEQKMLALEQQAETATQTLASTGEELQSFQQQLATLEGGLENADSKITVLESANTEQVGELVSLEEQITVLQTADDDLNRLTQTLKKQVAEQELLLQSLRERVSSGLASANTDSSASQIEQLALQVQENQEAVRAIDAFRITVNRELLSIKQRINAQ